MSRSDKASALAIDKEVLRVAVLLVLYLVVLMTINASVYSRNFLDILFSELFTRDVLFSLFLLFSLPLLGLLALWSRVIHFMRKPLNSAITVLCSVLFAAGVWLMYLSAADALWGNFTLTRGFAAAFLILSVAYLNSFLSTLSAQYEAANQEMLRAERFKSELITNVSHDIQTPLTSIINYTDLLQDLSVEDLRFNEKYAEYTEVLTRKSARLKTLTKDLVEASKAATGNLPVNMQTVNLVEVIWQVAGEFDDQFSDKDLAFVFDPVRDQCLIKADPRHLWRILENLFGNAAKYSLAGTRVFAELTFPPDADLSGDTEMFKLSLKNTSAEHLDQIAGELTEQFMRGDKSRHTEGSGLGLYIAKSLTELTDGQLKVRVSGDQFEAILLQQGTPGARSPH
ncbi:MAG: HAMP domain-containing histidine kinase [Coriobacteriia bacterium]|nr:HAMP domain-containing histidine kinase [Coriobacteriia bacterium]